MLEIFTSSKKKRRMKGSIEESIGIEGELQNLGLLDELRSLTDIHDRLKDICDFMEEKGSNKRKRENEELDKVAYIVTSDGKVHGPSDGDFFTHFLKSNDGKDYEKMERGYKKACVAMTDLLIGGGEIRGNVFTASGMVWTVVSREK